MKKYFLLILIGLVFSVYSVNLHTTPIDTKDTINTTNPIVRTQWTYHKDTPNYIYDDKDFCNLFFYSGRYVWLENCKGKCDKMEFNYTYEKPKITIYRFNVKLEGSINDDLMTLYDKDEKKYLFVKVNN